MDPIYERFLKETAKRNDKIIAARKAGLTVAQIAKAWDISPQRVSKICERLRKDKRAAA
jgi:chromosome segregation and condensation protein ScpB